MLESLELLKFGKWEYSVICSKLQPSSLQGETMLIIKMIECWTILLNYCMLLVCQIMLFHSAISYIRAFMSWQLTYHDARAKMPTKWYTSIWYLPMTWQMHLPNSLKLLDDFQFVEVFMKQSAIGIYMWQRTCPESPFSSFKVFSKRF